MENDIQTLQVKRSESLIRIGLKDENGKSCEVPFAITSYEQIVLDDLSIEYLFGDSSNNEFVHFSSKEMPKKKIEWIKYYHIFMKKLRNNYFYISGIANDRVFC